MEKDSLPLNMSVGADSTGMQLGASSFAAHSRQRPRGFNLFYTPCLTLPLPYRKLLPPTKQMSDIPLSPIAEFLQREYCRFVLHVGNKEITSSGSAPITAMRIFEGSSCRVRDIFVSLKPMATMFRRDAESRG